MKAPFYILMPVWGERFVGHLLTYALNTLLSPKNLPALVRRRPCHFVFLSGEKDEKAIRRTKLFGKLDQLADVSFIDCVEGGSKIDINNRPAIYHRLVTAFQRGAEEAMGKGYCLFLHPDGAYSDGMMTYLDKIADTGVEVVLGSGPVATEEGARSHLAAHGLISRDKVVSMTSRELVEAFLSSPHPEVLAHMPDHPSFTENPYMGVWKGPGKGNYLFRIFSLHPVLVDLRNRTSLASFGSIDHTFLVDNKFPRSGFHIVQDSDDFMVVGVKPVDEMVTIPGLARGRDVDKNLRRGLFSPSNVEYHRKNFLAGIRVHSQDLSEEWCDFESKNEDYVRMLIKTGRPALVLRLAKSLYYFLFYNPIYYHIEAFFLYLFVERKPGLAFRKVGRFLARKI